MPQTNFPPVWAAFLAPPRGPPQNLFFYTVKKAKHHTDDNTRVTENSVAHVDREAQSMLLADFSDHST
jgi:hypothetical protein